MAMNYEKAKKILGRYSEFPENEIGQRNIIGYGTKNGMIYRRGGGMVNYDCCPASQAYMVSRRLYSEARRVVNKHEKEIYGELCIGEERGFRNPNPEKVLDELVESFLDQTGTNSIEDWGGLEGLVEYLNPQ